MNMQLQRPSWGPCELAGGARASGSCPRPTLQLVAPGFSPLWSPASGCLWRSPGRGWLECLHHVFLVPADHPRSRLHDDHGPVCPWLLPSTPAACVPVWGCVSECASRLCVPKSTPCPPCPAVSVQGRGPGGLGCRGHELVSVCSGPEDQHRH